jgi:hypothetical protein
MSYDQIICLMCTRLNYKTAWLERYKIDFLQHKRYYVRLSWINGDGRWRGCGRDANKRSTTACREHDTTTRVGWELATLGLRRMHVRLRRGRARASRRHTGHTQAETVLRRQRATPAMRRGHSWPRRAHATPSHTGRGSRRGANWS